MAFAVLNYFSQMLTSFIEGVFEQVLGVFTISSLIGSYVVFYTTAIAGFLLFAVDTLCTVIKIVCKDFMVFLCDVVTIISIISDLILSVLIFSFEISVEILIDLRGVIFGILMLPILLYYKVLSGFENVVLLVVNTAALFKRALTLIGTSIWVALMLIPYSLSCVFHLIVSSCVNIACAVYDFSLGSTKDIFSRLYEIVFKLYNFFVDIPCEACGGLALGTLLIWLIYKKQHVIKAFCVDVYQLHLEATMVLIQLVRRPFQYIIHHVDLYRRHYLFSGRGRTSQSVTDILCENRSDSNVSTSEQGDNSNYMLNLKKKLEKELEEKMCSVCQERRKTVIVLPCRHLCMCEVCVLIVERISRKCPLCRRRIAKTMGVYL